MNRNQLTPHRNRAQARVETAKPEVNPAWLVAALVIGAVLLAVI